MTSDGTDTFVPDAAVNAIGPIATGPNNDVWFANSDGSVSRISSSGQLSTFQVPNQVLPPDRALDYPMVSGTDGAVWIGLPDGLDRITEQGALTFYPLPADPGSIAAGPGGEIWVTQPDSILLLQAPQSPLTVSGVTLSSEQAGAPSTYRVTFAPSPQGGLSDSAGDCPTSCSITITATAGTVLPAAASAYSVVAANGDRATVQSVSTSAAPDPATGQASSGTNQATLVLAGSTIGAGDSVTVTATGVINPQKATAGTWSTVSTSSDTTAEGSPPYPIIAGPPSIITMWNGSFSLPVGEPSAFNVKVTDAFGNINPHVAVTLQTPAVDPTATFSGCDAGGANDCTVVTDVNGEAQPNIRMGDVTGSFPITAAVGDGAADSLTATALPGVPARLEILSGSPQSAAVYSQFAQRLQVAVLDSYGNRVPGGGGSSVNFITDGYGTPWADAYFDARSAPGCAPTCLVPVGPDGTATAPPLTADSITGSYDVSALLGSSLATQFHLTNVPASAAAISVATSGAPRTVAAPRSALVTQQYQPFTVVALDSSGRRQPGVPVEFSAPAGGPSGTFAPCSLGNPHPWECATTTASDGSAGLPPVRLTHHWRGFGLAER